MIFPFSDASDSSTNKRKHRTPRTARFNCLGLSNESFPPSFRSWDNEFVRCTDAQNPNSKSYHGYDADLFQLPVSADGALYHLPRAQASFGVRFTGILGGIGFSVTTALLGFRTGYLSRPQGHLALIELNEGLLVEYTQPMLVFLFMISPATEIVLSIP